MGKQMKYIACFKSLTLTISILKAERILKGMDNTFRCDSSKRKDFFQAEQILSFWGRPPDMKKYVSTYFLLFLYKNILEQILSF